ncbi:MAG: hypothetical protein ABI140_12545 [Jatrophihabitantaceae bacterium]
MLANYATQTIRTASSYLVGALASFLLARFAFTMPESTKNWAIGAIVFAVGTGYYLLVSWVERRWPGAGWLLGKPSRPMYAAPAGTSPSADPTVAQLAVAVTEAAGPTQLPSPHTSLPDNQAAALAAAVTGSL